MHAYALRLNDTWLRRKSHDVAINMFSDTAVDAFSSTANVSAEEYRPSCVITNNIPELRNTGYSKRPGLLTNELLRGVYG